MFTGIIEEIGTVESIQKQGISAELRIKCSKVLEGTKLGDSIAVNGVCLTVVKLEQNGFWADVMTETMHRSNLSKIKEKDHVNLERAMAADGRFGGHMVSGHIDGIGNITQIQAEENAVWYTIEAAPELLHYIVEKGSVAIDGISLTVANVSEKNFQVSTIPHTRQETTLSEKQIGNFINIECDILGKYVERFVGGVKKQKESKITEEFLEKYGFC